MLKAPTAGPVRPERPLADSVVAPGVPAPRWVPIATNDAARTHPAAIVSALRMIDGRLERERKAVDAIATSGRFWTIVEDVPVMPAAAAAMNGLPHHPKGKISRRSDRFLDRSPEAGPAGAAVELGG